MRSGETPVSAVASRRRHEPTTPQPYLPSSIRTSHLTLCIQRTGAALPVRMSFATRALRMRSIVQPIKRHHQILAVRSLVFLVIRDIVVLLIRLFQVASLQVDRCLQPRACVIGLTATQRSSPHTLNVGIRQAAGAFRRGLRKGLFRSTLVAHRLLCLAQALPIPRSGAESDRLLTGLQSHRRCLTDQLNFANLSPRLRILRIESKHALQPLQMLFAPRHG